MTNVVYPGGALSQPQQKALVNWSYPLARQLAFLVSHNQIVYNAAPTATVSLGTGASTWATSHRGTRQGSSPDYNTQSYLNLNQSPTGLNPPELTLFGIAQTDTASGANACIIAQGNLSQTQTLFRLYQNGTTFSFQSRDSAGGGSNIDGPTAVVGQPATVVGVYRDGSRQKELYVNGVLAGTTSTAVGTVNFQTIAVGCILRSSGATLGWLGAIPIAGAFLGALSQDQVKFLSSNPFALLLPQNAPRIWSFFIDAGLTETLTGVSAASDVGTLSVDVTSDAAETLSGNSATSAVGTLSAGVTETETLGALSAAASVASVSVSVAFDADVTLTGVSVDASVADLDATEVGASLTETLTGVNASAAVGTLSVTADTADSVSIAGVSVAADVGTLDATSTQSLTETLTGVDAAGAVGDLTALISGAEDLTPLTALADVGVLDVQVSEEASIQLVGVEAAAEVFDLSADLSSNFDVELTGVSAAGAVRDLRIPDEEPLIDEVIRGLLAPLVQGHVHPLRRPQRVDQRESNAYLPEIVYTIVSDDWQQAETLCGVGLHATRVQIDVYAQHYREARGYAYAVAKEMDTIGWRINMQPFPDDDEKIYRWQLEYSCWRNEAPPSAPVSRTHR